MKDKISIIIPAFNATKFIQKTVESVLGQTYTNWELILVDDGSKDDTGMVIDAIASADERIKAVHQENGGEVAARRTGVLYATGNWIMFLDADDFLFADSCKKLLSVADDADIVVGTMHIQNFDENGVKFEDYVYQQRKIGWMNGTEFAIGVFLYQIQMAAWGKLYRKEIFDNFPWCLDRNIRQNPDLLMNIGLGAYVNKVFVTNEPIYDYIIHTGTASSGVMPFPNWMRLFDEARNYLKNYEPSQLLEEAFFHYRMSIFDNMLRHEIIDFPIDKHVMQALSECSQYKLTNDEKKLKILLPNMFLRKLFNWWQIHKLKKVKKQ